MPRAPYIFLLLALLPSCSQPTSFEPVLDKQSLLDRHDWWDNRDWDWYHANIPFFESPDADIDATYYYRWEVLTKHLVYGSPNTGYTFTEFIDRPFWSGTYGAISCPLGHQFYEIRWLKDRRILDDFARYWFETPGAQPRSYSNWYADALWASYAVTGDTAFIVSMLPHMEMQYQGWTEERFDPEHGLFRWDGMHDGMETNINSRQTERPFDGAEGYRPTLNSYLYADALAISRTAELAGEPRKAQQYDERAQALKQRVQEELWDTDRQFFFHQFAEDEEDGIRAKTLTHETGPHAGSPYGRELIGYVPWQFNLPDPGYEAAWQFLMDPNHFFAPFGPTVTERKDPLFLISPTCCVWSGNSWPYATTQTLVAFANLLNNYTQDVVDKNDYFRLLKVYSMTHRQEGRPYIAEALHPDTGSWDGHDLYYHSEHYLHSGYVDLIISGLVGLRPRTDDSLQLNPLIPDDWDYFALDDLAYHGHRLSVIWDRDGSRYARGAGLQVFANDQQIASAPTIQPLLSSLPPSPPLPSVKRPTNVAVNNEGGYPVISASYSHPKTPPFYAQDGNYWYHTTPPNRWTTLGSPNTSDWLALDFGVVRPIDTIKLYFLDDTTGIAPPEAYRLEYWVDEAWQDIPNQTRHLDQPTGRRANATTFPPLQTDKVRAVFTHADGSQTGLTEMEVWSQADLPLAAPTKPLPNLAFNADGTGFPAATASYTSRSSRTEQLNDGAIGFTNYQRNHWSALGSPNPTDWVQVDFGSPKTVTQVDLYLWGNAIRYHNRPDDGVRAPHSFTIQYWDEQTWHTAEPTLSFPETPTTMALNTIRITPVVTDRLRIVFTHDEPGKTAVSELMIWETIR